MCVSPPPPLPDRRRAGPAAGTGRRHRCRPLESGGRRHRRGHYAAPSPGGRIYRQGRPDLHHPGPGRRAQPHGGGGPRAARRADRAASGWKMPAARWCRCWRASRKPPWPRLARWTASRRLAWPSAPRCAATGSIIYRTKLKPEDKPKLAAITVLTPHSEDAAAEWTKLAGRRARRVRGARPGDRAAERAYADRIGQPDREAARARPDRGRVRPRADAGSWASAR